jgi:hypothetical protein
MNERTSLLGITSARNASHRGHVAVGSYAAVVMRVR